MANIDLSTLDRSSYITFSIYLATKYQKVCWQNLNFSFNFFVILYSYTIMYIYTILVQLLEPLGIWLIRDKFKP